MGRKSKLTRVNLCGRNFTQTQDVDSVMPDKTYMGEPVRLPSPEKYALNLQHEHFSAFESEFTFAVREELSGNRQLYAGRQAKQKPLQCYMNSPAMLMPLGSTRIGWLGYGEQMYWAFMAELSNALAHEGVTTGNDDLCEAALWQLIDYGVSYPYANDIRNDGRMSSPGFLDDVKDAARVGLDKVFRENFLYAADHLDQFLPSMNARKGLGWTNCMPDGTPLSLHKHDMMFGPKSHYDGLSSGDIEHQFPIFFRKNNAPVKLAWCESGRVLENLNFLLEHCREYDKDPRWFVAAMRKEAASIATVAERRNCPKLPHVEVGRDFDARRLLNGRNLMYDGRAFGFEMPEYSYTSGTYDNARYDAVVRKMLPLYFGCANRVRGIFPAPNASIMCAYILLFRMLSKRAEDSNHGMPSLHASVLTRLNRWLQAQKTFKNIKFLKIDRKTSEQFITDNLREILEVLPTWLSDLMRPILVAGVPGLTGLRVTLGLLSGTAPTTFLNMVVGELEKLCVIRRLFGDAFSTPSAWVQFVTNHVQAAFAGDVNAGGLEYEFVTKHGTFRVIMLLGTDDQTIPVATNEDLYVTIKDARFDEYCRQRSLEWSVGDSATSFGLNWTRDQVCMSPVVVVNKLFYMEKTEWGDEAAAKIIARFSQLGPLGGLVDDIFKRFFGVSIKEGYSKGCDNFLRTIEEFGMPGTDFYNEYNPTSALYMGSWLRQHGIDPVAGDGRYPETLMRPLAIAFKSFIQNYKEESSR